MKERSKPPAQQPAQVSKRTAAPQPAAAPTLTGPLDLLRLQRTLGNQSTAQIIARRQPPLIQRAMYLANADDNIYRDSDNPNADYAYITKGQVPFFIEYDRVDKLQQNAAINTWRQTQKPRDFNLTLDGLAAQAAAGNTDAQSVINDLGSIYTLDVTGKVIPRAINLANYADQLLVSQMVSGAVERGASYWNVGGGSRLPKGAGTLYYNKELPEAAVLGLLGLDKSDLASVQLQPVAEKMLGYVLNEAQTSGANLFQLGLGRTPADVIYVSTVSATRSKNSRVTCAGMNFADDFSNIGGNQALLDGSFKGLTPPKSTGWLPGTTLTTVDRGEGQAKAMKNWNALGAAAWGNHALGYSLNLNQNWEWLHIQGAQIGGQTVGGNLVPGLFVTNSHMIPYENMIREWAKADPTKFWARFSATPLSGTVFTDRISISIHAQGHAVLGDLTLEPFVTFNPIAGTIVDKVAGEIIKRGFDKLHGVQSYD